MRPSLGPRTYASSRPPQRPSDEVRKHVKEVACSHVRIVSGPGVNVKPAAPREHGPAAITRIVLQEQPMVGALAVGPGHPVVADNRPPEHAVARVQAGYGDGTH